MRLTNPLREYSHLLSCRLMTHLLSMRLETKPYELSKLYLKAQKLIKTQYSYQNEATYIEESNKKMKDAEREIEKYEMAMEMTS